MRRKIVGMLLVLTFSAWTTMAHAAAAAAPGAVGRPMGAVQPGQVKVMAAYIGIVEGKAQVLPDGVEPWKKAAVGMKLTPGTQVKTLADGSVTIAFTDGTKVQLGSNAQFKIENMSMSKVSVFMGMGKLNAWVKKLRGRLFQARNPVAVASVRGTVFGMDVVSPTQAFVDCFSGGLAVTDNFGRTQNVAGGQRLAADAATGAADPPTALPPNVTPPVEPTVNLPQLAAAAGDAPAVTPPPSDDEVAVEGDDADLDDTTADTGTETSAAQEVTTSCVETSGATDSTVTCK